MKMKSIEAVDLPDMEEVVKDERFKHIATDPRYREASKYKRKVTLDSRFASIFSDDRFYEKRTMDPRGRPTSFSNKENLKKFYNISDEDSDLSSGNSESEEEAGGSTTSRPKENKKKKSKESTSNDVLEKIKNSGTDYARGEFCFSSDSSLDDSTTDEEDGHVIEHFEWAELDIDAKWNNEEHEVQETYRFAVCNMDWDRVKAVDLLMLFASFTPPGGKVRMVTIYPSEYGKERLKEEEKHGPQELARMAVKYNSQRNSLKEEKDSASTSEIELLRKYQRNKLKYYFACVECNNTRTSVHVYNQCDRLPFEGAGVCLDLRYIPDDMDFSEEPHDVCSSAPSNYECLLPTPFTIFESKPSLTWDETDQHRSQILQNTMSKVQRKEDVDEEMLKHLIGSGSSSENSDSENSFDVSSKKASYEKFRSLIAEIDNAKNSSNFESEAHGENADESSNGESDESDHENKNLLTPFEMYLEKRKAKHTRLKNEKLEKKEKMMSLLKSKGSASEVYNQNSGDSDDISTVKRTKKKKKERKNIGDAEHPVDKNLELLVMGENHLKGKEHFNMRKIVSDSKVKSKTKLKKLQKNKIEEKKNKKLVDDFKIDAGDNRFSTLFSSGDYNIDPSHPSFKKTKQMESLLTDIQQKRVDDEIEENNEAKNIKKGEKKKKRNSDLDVDLQRLKKKMRSNR